MGEIDFVFLRSHKKCSFTFFMTFFVSNGYNIYLVAYVTKKTLNISKSNEKRSFNINLIC